MLCSFNNLFIALLFIFKTQNVAATICPDKCVCDEEEGLLSCTGISSTMVPSDWPTHYIKIHLFDCDLHTIQNNAFRRWHDLKEIKIERNKNLDFIDKKAFKGLKKLRELHILNNPRLSVISQGSFSNIGNAESLTIDISDNNIQVIQNDAFKNSHNIRKLIIKDKMFIFYRLSLIIQLDFLYISGLCVLQSYAFANTSKNDSIYFVYFFTHLLFYLATPETLNTEGISLIFKDNNVVCNCDMVWIKYYPDISLQQDNFCGAEQGHKSIHFYKPYNCGISKKELSSESQLTAQSSIVVTKYPDLITKISSSSRSFRYKKLPILLIFLSFKYFL
uniref:LRRCT domain-containing protein n=1 Tax=Rhabditophanes sp. KR3021 TaxID=114890 RepID=A0AC35U0M6_9BILA